MLFNKKQKLSITPFLSKIKINIPTPQTDCYYCLMKQKFNVGSSGITKCLQHTIANRQQSKQWQTSYQIPLNLEQIIDSLKKIDEAIEYYLPSIQSQNNNIGKTLGQIYLKINKIYNKISKSIGQSYSKYSINQQNKLKYLSTTEQIKSINNIPIIKIQNTQNRSFYQKNYYSAYQDSQMISTSDVLKQWLMHFHKILIAKDQKQQIDVLAQNLFLQKNLDLQIFKQSMQRKFINIKQKYKILEKRLSLSLQKLLFYMQKSEGIVPSYKIKSDIIFLQANQGFNQMALDQSYVQKFLLSQALTIESLLDQQKQLDSYIS